MRNPVRFQARTFLNVALLFQLVGYVGLIISDYWDVNRWIVGVLMVVGFGVAVPAFILYVVMFRRERRAAYAGDSADVTRRDS